MQVIETLAEGLKRELKVVIPAADMKARLDERLVDAKDKVRINGFRPGKVPVGHLKKMYGKSIMADLVNELVREKPTEILSSRGEKSATQPSISMTEDEQEAEKILSAESEDQLVGVKAGDEKTITVTFPADYPAANLAGKEANFDITVKEVAAAAAVEINDELATKLGLESAEKLKEIVKGQIESQYGNITRQKVKRQILDQLDEMYKFDTPAGLVDAEFDNIWRQINTDLAQSGKTFADEDTTEEEAREEYRKLAERRVRLGLVLSEIGEKAGVEVTEEEMQRALFQQLQQFPGQQKEILDFFRNTPGASASLRAPIFEEKVIDKLLSEIAVTDKTVSKEELLADDAEEATETKKKAPAKKKAAAKADDAAEGEEAAPKKKAPAKKKAAEGDAE